MPKIKALFFVLSAILLTNSMLTSGANMSDFILLNGVVWTGNPAQPWAEAVWIRGDKIFKVGSSADFAGSSPKGASVVDLHGEFVLPGFFDCHTHFLQGGFALSSIQLRDVISREEFVAKIEDYVKTVDKGTWILNGNWDHEQMDSQVLPTREWIDKVTPDNPVFVRRYDLHMGLANSLALKIAGITRETAVPKGGEIVIDPVTGEPTGILKEAAMELVTSRIPEPTLKENRRATEAALRHAAECGVTSVHEMAYPTMADDNFEVFQNLLKANKLTARIFVYFPITESDLLIRLKMNSPFGNEFLKIGGLKGFVDGSVGSSTACFLEPYTDSPAYYGMLNPQMSPDGVMEKRIDEADLAGLQVSIHAIGDKANKTILDIFERVIAKNGPRDRRWRIEHAQHLRAGDIERFGRLGIIASVQPYHAIDDGRWMEKRIGKERSRTTYAFKSLLDSGAKLALGSDWMVAPLDPLSGIHAAVTRATIDGKNPGGWYPEQKLSVEEAVKGYTIDAAYSEFAEGQKGSIEGGKLADLVVLDQNVFKIAPEKIKDARVNMTIVGGKIVYRRGQPQKAAATTKGEKKPMRPEPAPQAR
jgi:predicted amidohydrolase YtcJ